ncbi:MAG: hypothetical protein HQL71_01860 [Magnetococcales bacterium]|nr:hypothetical protein [Magnetococcales bacterium]
MSSVLKYVDGSQLPTNWLTELGGRPDQKYKVTIESDSEDQDFEEAALKALESQESRDALEKLASHFKERKFENSIKI